MVMNSNLQLALRIAGTKERRAGFAPLVSVGVLPGGEGENMYRSTMVAERPVYVIKHAEGYILYQLIDRGVKPFDADANGLLNIALAISRNVQLAEGKSPFTLLDEVYKKFVDTYMEPKSDGRLSFLNTDNDDGIFREIVGKYSLEGRKSPYIVMNPTGLTGIVCVAPADMEDFFKDTQYKEFASYKDIEVGINCHGQVSPEFANLKIPLPPPVFNVWVNGEPTGKSLQFHEDGYTATAANTDLYTYESVDFTLGELLEAPSNRISKNGATVTLDFINNCISCDLKKKDIYYKIVYDWTDNIKEAQDKIKSLIITKKVKIKLGEKDISNTVFTENEFKAADINNCNITIEPQVVEKFKLSLKCITDSENHEIVTKIIIKRRATTGSGGTGGSNIIGHGGQSNVNQPGGNVSDSGNTQTKQPEPQNKKKFDVMSFVLGLVVGLLIGLGIWGGVALLSGDKAVPNGDDVKPDSTITIDDTVLKVDNAMDGTDVQDSNQFNGENQWPKSESTDFVILENNAADKLKEAEKRKKEEEAKKKAQEKKDAERAKILELVNQKKLTAFRNTRNKEKILSKEEISAIEAILDKEKYNDITGTEKMKLKKLFEKKTTFNTYQEILDTQKKIWEIIGGNNVGE